MENLTDSGVVVCIAAGNNGGWADSTLNLEYRYADDINMHTAGSSEVKGENHFTDVKSDK